MFFFRFFSHIGYYKIPSIVPCAVHTGNYRCRSLLFILYIVVYICYSQIPNLSLPCPPFPLW